MARMQVPAGLLHCGVCTEQSLTGCLQQQPAGERAGVDTDDEPSEGRGRVGACPLGPSPASKPPRPEMSPGESLQTLVCHKDSVWVSSVRVFAWPPQLAAVVIAIFPTMAISPHQRSCVFEEVRHQEPGPHQAPLWVHRRVAAGGTDSCHQLGSSLSPDINRGRTSLTGSIYSLVWGRLAPSGGSWCNNLSALLLPGRKVEDLLERLTTS